jgi:REP element-mobilizing transposase RayT
MPRKPRIFQSIYPYNVSSRAWNRREFAADLERVWSFSGDLLWFCSHAFNVQIHSYVLMPNHYHLLVRTPDANLDKFMNYFNRELSRELSYGNRQINQQFGSRYFAEVIDNQISYSNVYRYIYRNPVEAHLCGFVEEYQYSSIQYVLGNERAAFPIFDTHFETLQGREQTLDWLNTSYKHQEFFPLRASLKGSLPASVSERSGKSGKCQALLSGNSQNL